MCLLSPSPLRTEGWYYIVGLIKYLVQLIQSFIKLSEEESGTENVFSSPAPYFLQT